MHILMADDDKEEFFILKEAAQEAGEPLQISYAANWIQLWRAILKKIPDVLFLDINMPVKDGLECLRLLREDRKYDKIPIVMYSTSVSKNDIDKAYMHGANYFLVKPATINDITSMVKKICTMSRDVLLSVPPREEFVII